LHLNKVLSADTGQLFLQALIVKQAFMQNDQHNQQPLPLKAQPLSEAVPSKPGTPNSNVLEKRMPF